MRTDNALSPIFCAEDADTIFKSSDNVIFKVHRKNIEFSSAGLAALENSSNKEGGGLEESSNVLELLFRFMYPQRQPDLESIEFETLKDLAAAADKYEVYSAIQTCKMAMRQAASEHPTAVLVYAAKHGYSELVKLASSLVLEKSPISVLRCACRFDIKTLMNKAAPLTIKLSTAEVMKYLSQRDLKTWILYRNQWEILHREAERDVILMVRKYSDSENLVDTLTAVLECLNAGPSSLLDLSITLKAVDARKPIMDILQKRWDGKMQIFKPFEYFWDAEE